MDRNRRSPASFLPLRPVEFHILLSVARGERHGYGIMKQVERESHGKVKMGPGTLYGSIGRMIEAGLIRESDKRPDPDLDDERRRLLQGASQRQDLRVGETGPQSRHDPVGKVGGHGERHPVERTAIAACRYLLLGSARLIKRRFGHHSGIGVELSVHPLENRMLSVVYSYAVPSDAKARMDDAMVVLGEIEAFTPPVPAGEGELPAGDTEPPTAPDAAAGE